MVNLRSAFSAALRMVSSKIDWNAIELCGNRLGVGYVFSRYSAIRKESATETPVDVS